jgi:hypothetical protein
MSEYTCEYTTPDSIIFTHATKPQFKINVGDNYNFIFRRGSSPPLYIKVTRIDPVSDNPTKPGVIYYNALASRGKFSPFVAGQTEPIYENPVFSEAERSIKVSSILGLVNNDNKNISVIGGGVSNRSKRSKKTKSKRGGRRSRCRSIKKYRTVRKSRRRRYTRS